MKAGQHFSKQTRIKTAGEQNHSRKKKKKKKTTEKKKKKQQQRQQKQNQGDFALIYSPRDFIEAQ